MAAIEDILAWCTHERARLAHQLEQLQSGQLRTYEKQAQPAGWLEIDTTAQSIDLCRQYISELNAIAARYPEVVATPPAAIAPPPAAVAVPPVARIVAEPRPAPPGDDVQPDWISGWGVVKGTQPNWDFEGIYHSRAEAEEAVAKAGKGYYARWGTYNAGSKEFSSGPGFSSL